MRSDAQSSQGARQSGAAGSGLGLDPVGWVAIAYDYDEDGTYDAFEYIYAYDLETARQRSQQRAQRGEMGGSQGQSQARQGSRLQSQQSRRQATQRFGQARSGSFRRDMGQSQATQAGFGQSAAIFQIQGDIQEMKTLGLAGCEEPHAIARVRTQDGRVARVDLGPKTDIQQLRLKSGDTISVVGMPGRINDRPVLMAARIEHDGQMHDVQRPDNMGLERHEGQIQDLTRVSFQALDEDHLVAQVRLQDGQTVPVDLGPLSQVRKANLQTGDRIDFLADTVTVNDRRSLRADRFRVNGSTFHVDRELEKEQLRRQSGMGHQYSTAHRN